MSTSVLAPPATATLTRPLRRRGVRVRPSVVLAVAVLLLALGFAVAPGLFTAADPLVGTAREALRPPSAAHWFGTDATGRDVFTRVVYGAVHSLGGALVAVLVGLAAGTALGLLAGSIGGWVDAALMRVVDVLLAIPGLLLALWVVSSRRW